MLCICCDCWIPPPPPSLISRVATSTRALHASEHCAAAVLAMRHPVPRSLVAGADRRACILIRQQATL